MVFNINYFDVFIDDLKLNVDKINQNKTYQISKRIFLNSIPILLTFGSIKKKIYPIILTSSVVKSGFEVNKKLKNGSSILESSNPIFSTALKVIRYASKLKGIQAVCIITEAIQLVRIVSKLNNDTQKTDSEKFFYNGLKFITCLLTISLLFTANFKINFMCFILKLIGKLMKSYTLFSKENYIDLPFIFVNCMLFANNNFKSCVIK